jgi:uncharacterized protein
MPVIDETGYTAPYFFSNRHIGTVVPNLLRFPFGVRYNRERIFTTDGDFLDLDWSRQGSKKLIVLSHGLESSSKAAYILGMVKYFNKRGYDALAWNFRSCSGEVNLTVPFYHPGQTDDYQLVIDRAIAEGYTSIYLMGFSLGGAITLRYLGEKGKTLAPQIKRAVVFSVPTDLGAAARHLSQGPSSVYGSLFLLRYKKKMQIKAKRMPNTYDMGAWENIKTMMDFDAAFNVPWFNLADADEFYSKFTPSAVIPDITLPTLIVNAMNDPFLPQACYPFLEATEKPNLFLEVPEFGGHVGFMASSWKGIYWSESRAEAFLNEEAG